MRRSLISAKFLLYTERDADGVGDTPMNQLKSATLIDLKQLMACSPCLACDYVPPKPGQGHTNNFGGIVQIDSFNC